jgi:hypothetical protein
MANGIKPKDKDPMLSCAVSQELYDALDRAHHADRAAPSWSYTVRRVLLAGLATLGVEVDPEPAVEAEQP